MSAATALANWSLALLQQSEQCEQLGPKEDLLRAILNVILQIREFNNIFYF